MGKGDGGGGAQAETVINNNKQRNICLSLRLSTFHGDKVSNDRGFENIASIYQLWVRSITYVVMAFGCVITL